MIVVGVCGSPRQQATEYILKESLRMVEDKGIETHFWPVRGKHMSFCTHCDYCLKNKECIFKDDLQELYELLGKADGIIFATPVYNGGVSSQIKTVMDRSRSVVASDKDFFKHKIGMAIAAGGDRVGGQEAAILQIHTFYILNGVIPVSGGFFGANLGAAFWTKDTLEGAKQDAEGMKNLKKTVKRFTEYLNKYRGAINGSN